ncbi:MAG: type II secretion system F family protein [Candidatus Anstonellales archaeon]
MFIFDFIGRIFPRKYIKKIDSKLQRAGFNIYAEEFLGFLIIFSLLLGALLIFLAYGIDFLTNFYKMITSILFNTIDETSLAFFVVNVVVSFLTSFLFIGLSIWMYLDYREEKRRTEIEKHLPDYLMLIASNVKSGVLIEHAIWDAAKPEFGLLSVEMEKLAKLAIGGRSFAEVLEIFNQRVGSRVINQLIVLINQSIASGGEIAKVLEQTASEIRSLQQLQREIASSMVMYGIFIMVAGLIMTPVLFALSYNLINILNKVFEKVPPYRANLRFTSISFTAPTIKADTFYWFCIFTIVLTTLTSLMMYGVFKNGHYTSGLRLFPFLVIFTIIFFVIAADLMKKTMVVNI